MLHMAVMSFPWLTGAGGVVLVLMTSEFSGHRVQLFLSALSQPWLHRLSNSNKHLNLPLL